MPPALDRLLASPSALRVLRSIINAPDLPPACCPALHGCRLLTSRHHYSAKAKPPAPNRWPLWHQSSKEPTVSPLLGLHHLPVDQPKNVAIDAINEPAQVALWAQTLQYCQRVYGESGIRDIWLAHRGYLPANDTLDAEALWGTFLQHPDLVAPVIDHAVELYKVTGRTYPHLYKLCMTYWLPRIQSIREKERLLDYHHRIVFKLKLRSLPLREIAKSTRSRFTRRSYEAFMEIYRMSNERDVYDEIVPHLCKKGEVDLARRWHHLCVLRSDLLSDFSDPHPLVSLFSAETSATAETRPEARHPRPHVKPEYNEQLMRRLLGRETAPVKFEDSFCAKMFATRAFPPESIIQGLAMVGVNQIGPQSLRTMALRTEPLSDLPKRFEDLKAAGITLEGCVFSLALEKFAAEGRWHLVQSMLDSDQHPDVFGNRDTQKDLLHYYLQERDYIQAHRTIAILALFHNDTTITSWNILLKAHIRNFDPDQIHQVLEDMRMNNILVNARTIAKIKSMLRHRRHVHKPTQSNPAKFDDLRFVTRMLIFILESGIGRVPPYVWRELLRRYGMRGRLRELRRLSYWLLCWYAPRNGAGFDALPKSSFLDAATEKMRIAYPGQSAYFTYSASRSAEENGGHPIRELFPHSFQQALIVWGIRSGTLPWATLEQSMLSPIPAKRHHRRQLLNQGILQRADWSIGLRTLVQLRDLGVFVHRNTVVKTLQAQFVVLFGHGRSRRKENNVVKAVNNIPYADYVHKVNEIWGSPLFPVPGFNSVHVHGHSWHPHLPRNVQGRRSFLHIDEILGPDWNKSAKVDGDGHHVGQHGSQQRSGRARSQATNNKHAYDGLVDLQRPSGSSESG